MKSDVFSPGDMPTLFQDVTFVCLFSSLKQSIKVVIISLRISYICCHVGNGEHHSLVCEVFPFLIQWKIIWDHQGSWRRWSIRGLWLWAMCGLPFLCYTPGVILSISSDQPNHICEILIPASQTYTHFHRVLWIRCDHYVVQIVTL